MTKKEKRIQDQFFVHPCSHRDTQGDMVPGEGEGKLINNLPIKHDNLPENGEECVIVRVKKPKKKTKIYAPEEYILELAEKDLEELY